MGKNLDKSEEEIKGRKKLYIGKNFSQAIRHSLFRHLPNVCFNILKGYYRIATRDIAVFRELAVYRFNILKGSPFSARCFNILKGYYRIATKKVAKSFNILKGYFAIATTYWS